MTHPDTVGECLNWAARALAPHSESPRLDAELLLGKVLAASRAGLVVRRADRMTPAGRRSYARLVARRRRGAPVAYLTGSREFWSLPLAVTPAVLVPRPETELLVELALERLPAGEACTVLDLGTGSGAIALAIGRERPRARITAVDVSEAALAVARQNAASLGLPSIAWRSGSWFDAVPGERFDVIVANPPYIAAGDAALSRLAAEPLQALVSGPTGVEALEIIAGGASAHLQEAGRLLLEHGSGQARQVAALLEHGGFEEIRSHVDTSGMARVTSGIVRSNY